MNNITWSGYTYVLQYASIGGPTFFDIWLDSERFDGLQNWPGVSASCPYTGCRTDGTRF